ncbi:MAG: hypothetical protein KF812_03645 [Fimbriimonadaceae bacterium]|nr:hypothetical protein [Fimbriimonadaceae bacterium]
MIVFLLGAGASIDARPEMPGVSNLFPDGISLVESDQVEWFRTRHLEDLFPDYKGTGFNIELLMSQIRSMKDHASARHFARQVESEVKRAVRMRLIKLQGHRAFTEPISVPLNEESVYHFLLSLDQESLAISLNWDTLFEHIACNNVGMHCRGWFEQLVPTTHYTQKLTGASAPASRFSMFGEKRLLKLHGSIHWMHCYNSYCPQHHVPFLTYSRPDIPETVSVHHEESVLNCHELFCSACGSDMNPMLQDLIAMKQYDANRTFQFLYNVAFEALRTCDAICIFGCSLSETDLGLRSLLRMALTQREINRDLRIVIGNIDKPTVDNSVSFFSKFKDVVLRRSGSNLSVQGETDTSKFKDIINEFPSFAPLK